MTKLTATSPDGSQTVEYTGKRKGVQWATWARFDGEGWSHFGWTTASDKAKAAKAAKSTNPYAAEYDATPAA